MGLASLRAADALQAEPRHGVEIDRSSLANWVGGACWWLEPLQACLAAHVRQDCRSLIGAAPRLRRCCRAHVAASSLIERERK